MIPDIDKGARRGCGTAAGEGLQLGVGGWERRFVEGKAGDGAAEDGCQVDVIGLDVEAGGLAKAVGGEGMDGTDVDGCLAASSLERFVVVAGAFEDDDEVLEVMLAGFS